MSDRTHLGLAALALGLASGCTCISLDDLQAGNVGGGGGDTGGAGPNTNGPGPGAGAGGVGAGSDGGNGGNGTGAQGGAPATGGGGSGPGNGGAGGAADEAYEDCVLADGPALFYRMDSPTSSEPNLGTFSGSATYVGTVLEAPALIGGGGLTAKKFNPGSSLEEQTGMLMGGTQHVSIEAWVRFGSAMSVAGPSSNVFDTVPLVAEIGVMPRFDQTGMDQLYFAIQGGDRQTFDNGNFIQQPTEVFHVVAVYRQSAPPPTTSDDMLIYVNGELTSLLATGSSVAMGAIQTLRIGGSGFGSAADGAEIDEFALYTYELTQADVDRHFNAGTTGTCD